MGLDFLNKATGGGGGGDGMKNQSVSPQSSSLDNTSFLTSSNVVSLKTLDEDVLTSSSSSSLVNDQVEDSKGGNVSSVNGSIITSVAEKTVCDIMNSIEIKNESMFNLTSKVNEDKLEEPVFEPVSAVNPASTQNESSIYEGCGVSMNGISSQNLIGDKVIEQTQEDSSTSVGFSLNVNSNVNISV